jgi:mutator protein MutT|tara:strand:- start:1603 stop:1995 length:393 start_codon:yes stop_codon:yes gene_type:complete
MEPEGRVAVIAAVIQRGDKYLLGQRPESKRHGGLWEFPGGKVHDGESRLEAIRRELAEELALKVVRIERLLFSVVDKGSPYVIEFVETIIEGTPIPYEHSEIAWLTIGELDELRLAPADAALAAHLRPDA